MAKQLVGPIERHVEKAILGAAGILLVGVVATYLATSPTQMDLGGTVVSPSTVDERLLAKATELRDRWQKGRPKGGMPDTLAPEFDQYARRIGQQLSIDLPTGVLIGPTVPIIDPPEVILGDAALVEVVQLARPTVAQGRSTLDTAAGYVPTNWVTVSGLFSRKEQQARQAAAYGATRQEVLFGPVQIQRRAQRADGSWSDDDWATADASPEPELPKAPTLTLDTSGDETVIEREQLSLLRRYAEALRIEVGQVDLVHPLMLDVLNGDTWRFPILTTYNDVLLQDDEILHPNQEGPTQVLDDRYGLDSDEAAVVVHVTLTPAQEIAAHMALGKKLLAQAKANHIENDAIGAYNEFESIVQHPNGSASQKNQAERLKREANQVANDIRRRKTRGIGATGTAAADVQRKLLPTLQLWAHDSAVDSVESGSTYQYRIRAQVYNQLAGEPAKFANKEDALVLMIPGRWSEPTEPVVVVPTNYFFATAADKRKKNVSFDLYRWFDGYWVTNKTKLKCEVGDVVEQEQRVAVPNPEVPDEIDYPLTTFAPRVTVVGIEFDRRYRERNARGGGVKFSKPTVTPSVVLVNAAGELQERFVTADKGDAMRKSVGDRVFKPSRR